MTAAVAVRRPARGWAAGALRAMEFVANPALAGAAFCLLCLGVVTWLPALAAVGNALHRWRTEDEQACFVGVLRAFPGYWRALWKHAVVSTVAAAVLVFNVAFLAVEGSGVALLLLFAQVGVGLVVLPYHLALGAVAGSTPDGSPAQWRRAAVLLAFGSVTRGTGLLLAMVAAPVLTVFVPLGPLLLGPSLPMLYALHLTGGRR